MRKLKRELRALPIAGLQADDDFPLRRPHPRSLRMVVAMMHDDGTDASLRTMPGDFRRGGKCDGADFIRADLAPAAVLHSDVQRCRGGLRDAGEKRHWDHCEQCEEMKCLHAGKAMVIRHMFREA